MKAEDPVVKTLECKVTLKAKHRLLSLLGATLERPAIRQRVEAAKADNVSNGYSLS